MYKKYLAGVSAGILVASGLVQTAGAADLPAEIQVVEPVAVSPLWSGFYVGGQIGYAFGADIGRNPRFRDFDRRGSRIVNDASECFSPDEPNRDAVREIPIRLREKLESGALAAPLDLEDPRVQDELTDVFDGFLQDLPQKETDEARIVELEDLVIAFDDTNINFNCILAYIGDFDESGRGASGPYRVSHHEDDNGFEAGIYVGADRQYGSFVFGALADLNYIDLGSDMTAFDSDGATAFSANVDLDWYATLRARAGFAFDRFLVYAHGGLAYARIDADGTGRNVTVVEEAVACDNELGCFNELDFGVEQASFHEDKDLWGYAVGVGGEALITEKVSAKVEYQYTNLGEETLGGLFDETESAEVEVDFHTVRLGVAFRF